MILNRIVAVTENVLVYEADPRHAEILMRDVDVDEGSTGVVTPQVSAGDEGKLEKCKLEERVFVQSGGGEGELLRPGPDGHAVFGGGNFEIHVEAGGA